jgi:hypothetical protein
MPNKKMEPIGCVRKKLAFCVPIGSVPPKEIHLTQNLFELKKRYTGTQIGQRGEERKIHCCKRSLLGVLETLLGKPS